jgi:glycosyltransferase involved in cell wall biosynthesis
MKILLIANYRSAVGGISGQVKLLREKLAAENHEVCLFNTKKSNALRMLLPFQLLWQGRDKDIYHIHGCSFAGFFPIVLGMIVGKIMRKKVIVTYHGGGAEEFFARYPRLIKTIFRRADHIIVLSDYLKRVFDKYQLDTEIIPNIIEVKPEHYLARTAFKPVMITTRSLNAVYDIKTAIKAFALVKQSQKDAILYVVGRGDQETELKQFVAAAEIKDVTFTGYVENEKIYEYLNKADFWCNPTTKDNMPVSLIEAINAGLVVVSTNVGGIPFMVEHKRSAWLVAENDDRAMAEGILFLLAHQDVCKTMVANARETLRNYRWESIRESIMRLYER